MVNRLGTGLLVAVVCALATSIANAGSELIEIRVEDDTYQGRIVAHNASRFWLVDRAGRMHRFPISGVKEFRKVAKTFRGFRAAEMRNNLRQEFGSKYEVAGTTHYLVVARKGRAATYAGVFEDVYRKFRSYVSRRGFTVKRPDFPMVAVVFSTKTEFLEYSRKDGVHFGFNVLGYYHPISNRVALYDSLNRTVGRNDKTELPSSVFARLSETNPTLHDTIVHEGTHQAAFNVGLHTRIGQTPRWVVEGIAMVFEAPAIRNRSVSGNAKSRVNNGRLEHFLEYAEKRRGVRKLGHFIADDTAFRRPLDAYSESWALMYFLIEKKSLELSRYLKLINQRDPLKPYSARDRIADFQQAFGKDLDHIERDYLRFVVSLK